MAITDHFTIQSTAVNNSETALVIPANTYEIWLSANFASATVWNFRIATGGTNLSIVSPEVLHIRNRNLGGRTVYVHSAGNGAITSLCAHGAVGPVT